jgi:large subunit ribosomal protein L18
MTQGVKSDFLSKKQRGKVARRQRAHRRVRSRVTGTSERPRLAVFKSDKHIYAQLIDDQAGHTLAQASTLDAEVRGRLEGGTGNLAAAKAVGTVVGERARAAGVEKVVFDRGGYIYHGKVKAIAEAAREQGLQF